MLDHIVVNIGQDEVFIRNVIPMDVRLLTWEMLYGILGKLVVVLNVRIDLRRAAL
jgi:hypothetical protein